MTIQELRSKLYQAVSKDHMDDVFGLLIDNLKKEGPIWDELTDLRQSYNFLKTQILQRNVGMAESEIERNRLSGKLLELSNTLTDEDIRPDGEYTAQLIGNPILIITHNTEQNLDIRAFAEMLKFSNVEVRNLMSYVPDDHVYDLIVFDNKDLSRCDSKEQLESGNFPDPQLMYDRIDLMERYLENTHYYFIHYGPFLFWAEEHNSRFRQAANRFELFGCIREMLQFLKAFRV